jgi:hypothetical protein
MGKLLLMVILVVLVGGVRRRVYRVLVALGL